MQHSGNANMLMFIMFTICSLIIGKQSSLNLTEQECHFCQAEVHQCTCPCLPTPSMSAETCPLHALIWKRMGGRGVQRGRGRYQTTRGGSGSSLFIPAETTLNMCTAAAMPSECTAASFR